MRDEILFRLLCCLRLRLKADVFDRQMLELAAFASVRGVQQTAFLGNAFVFGFEFGIVRQCIDERRFQLANMFFYRPFQRSQSIAFGQFDGATLQSGLEEKRQQIKSSEKKCAFFLRNKKQNAAAGESACKKEYYIKLCRIMKII